MKSRLIALGALAASVLVAGCTVQPLYGSGPTASLGGGSVSGDLPSDAAQIWVAQPRDRIEQEIRNHLSFNFYRGEARPVDPKYQLDFFIRRDESHGAKLYGRGSGRDAAPTASILTLTAVYNMIDVRTGEQVSSGKHIASANYDIPSQGFAAERAKRDAENRAARELANFISLSVIADMRRSEPLAKRPTAVMPAAMPDDIAPSDS